MSYQGSSSMTLFITHWIVSSLKIIKKTNSEHQLQQSNWLEGKKKKKKKITNKKKKNTKINSFY